MKPKPKYQNELCKTEAPRRTWGQMENICQLSQTAVTLVAISRNTNNDDGYHALLYVWKRCTPCPKMNSWRCSPSQGDWMTSSENDWRPLKCPVDFVVVSEEWLQRKNIQSYKDAQERRADGTQGHASSMSISMPTIIPICHTQSTTFMNLRDWVLS